MKPGLTLILIAGMSLALQPPSFGQPAQINMPEISFNDQVRPILSDKCFHCHGPDANNQKSEFRLDTEAHARAELDSGRIGIAPGDLEASEVHHRIRDTADGEAMPPADAVRQLTDEEKDIIDAWIQSGAKFENHWSFEPLPKQIELPNLDQPWQKQWVLNDVDVFVAAKMHRQGFTPNEATSKPRWLRRVTFDLTGLPPTAEEIEAFLEDSSPIAFERVVDGLLQRTATAERLTTEWLDVARYSDSYGYQRDDERYVWPYRDWVISAFKQNMPYDQFVTWQLAGDLMPNATREQILATTFNRLHSHKKEGGVEVEEFRVENVADRTHTVGAAFMGLTFECARCHDHKYDPVTTKDYYQLSSYFANIDENGLISYFTDAVPTPTMPLPTPQQEQQLAAAAKKIAAAEEVLIQTRQSAKSKFKNWLPQRKSFQTTELSGMVAYLPLDESEAPQAFEEIDEYDAKKKKAAKLDKFFGLENVAAPNKQARTPKTNQVVAGKVRSAIRLTGDDPIEIPDTGRFSRDQPFSVALWIQPDKNAQRSVIYRRSRGWDDAGSIGYELVQLGGKLNAKLVHFWPGNAICVETDAVLKPKTWTHVAVTYDGSSKAQGLKIFVNGTQAKTSVIQDRLTRQITKWRGNDLDLAIGSRYRDRGFKNGLVDEFFAFERTLSLLEVQQIFDGQSLNNDLSTPIEQLTSVQRQSLLDYYLLAIDSDCLQARKDLQTARHGWNQIMDSIPAITTMREQEKPRPAFILERGVYSNRKTPVTADTPSFLPAFPEDLPKNRLGLAKWLTSKNHPLTARVTVNRYWQMMFGYGLVRTPEDFGVQGARPTHPELLDWLARDFIEHDWDVRRLLRQIALSATYRQSTVVPPDVRARDPENLYLARGIQRRLSAEMIRDNVLAVSGLLSRKVGGKPVKPYDINLSYKPQDPDRGEGLYRRSLYTFWQRTAPAPVMMTLNANKRDVCRLRREVVPSPLQALVTMNGTQFIESARVTAAKLIKAHGEDKTALIRAAYLQLTSEFPDERRTEILRQLLNEQIEIYSADTGSAKELLSIGDAPGAADLPADYHAAATILVNSIMNIDPAVRFQ